MTPKEILDHMMEFIDQLDGVTIVDHNGYYLFVSDSWTRAMGYTLEELKGKKAKDIFPDSQSDIAMREGRAIIGHPVRWGKNRAPGFTNYYPAFNEDGTVWGCYCLVMISGIDNAIVVQNQISELYERLQHYEQELANRNGARYSLEHIIGASAKMEALRSQIKKVAHSNSTVLIEGETGTGKELVAHAIHQLSPRSTHNFVRANCAAIPPELMESEFFGYARGAFTGASSKGKIGKFQFADHGSIFLDEINSLPLAMQPKFLRVLQEREVEPVGSTETIPIDVRVIAASNTSLEKQVVDGTFRRDLYYRLNVVRIRVPPLRERKEDIPELAEGLIQRLNRLLGTHTQSVSDSALRLLMEYDWPGNIRELQNALEMAMNVADSDILRREDFVDLTERANAKEYQRMMQENHYNLKASKAAFEKRLILEVLEMSGNNHSRAAQTLGISRTMLYKKLEQYNIPIS